MLYFVKPFGLEWTDNVGQEVINFARDAGKDLGTLTDWWKPSERERTEDDLRAALRYGIAATGGIVVAATHVVTVHRPHTLRLLTVESAVRMQKYRASPQVQAIDDVMEQMAPGWKEHGVELDQDVANSMKESLREAEAESAEELAVAVQPDLVRHWELQGGVAPSPL